MRLRADDALVEAGLCDSVLSARALIMEGKALEGSTKIKYPSDPIKHPELLRLKNGAALEYVSRGAYKLKRAFEVFDISVKDMVCADIGASTGGFTDIMLRNGAKKVYCVDVGYNLLDWKIRSNPKVTVMERTNARLLNANSFGEQIDFGATDVSFISLKTVLPAVFTALKPEAHFVALIKPQFEAEKALVGEKGVVRDASTHIQVIQDVCEFLSQNKISVQGLNYSPIKGPEGNIEFLALLKNDFKGDCISHVTIDEVVAAAHSALC